MTKRVALIAHIPAFRAGKTLALMAQMQAAKAEIAQAFAVPEEYLGSETNGTLTGEELRSIMEQQPELREPEPQPTRPSKNPFAEGSIKRYAK